MYTLDDEPDGGEITTPRFGDVAKQFKFTVTNARSAKNPQSARNKKKNTITAGEGKTIEANV